MNSFGSHTFSLVIALAVVGATGRLQPVLADDGESEQEKTLTTKFKIDDADPESSVPSAQEALRMPLQMGYHIMLLSERAQAATTAGDHSAAARYWRALAKAAPDRSLAHSKACLEAEAAGELDKALASCRTAITKPGATLEDSVRYVALLIKKPEFGATETAEIDTIRKHVEEQLPGDKGGPVFANRMLCQLGVRLSDAARLEACTKQLNALAPKDPETVLFTWSLAVMKQDYSRAEAALQQAEQNKMPHSAIERMRKKLEAEREEHKPWWRRVRPVPLAVLAVCVLALMAGAGVFLRLRRAQ